MKIRFYNRDGRWFADLPHFLEAGGTEDDCEMVAGANDWLDILSGYKDSVTLEISPNTPLQEQLHMYSSDEFGATYIAHEYKEETINHQLWLCPVTLFVFGEYPAVLNYRVC